MSKPRILANVEVTHLLLVITMIELGVNRLAVPTLRPDGDEAPPGWHQTLDHIGLFLLFFATTLAMGVIARQLWRVIRREEPYWTVPRYGLPAVGLAFLVLAAANVGTNPNASMSFVFDTSFTLMVLMVVLAQWGRAGDLGAKIGLVALATPLLIHYWTPFALSFLEGEEAVWGDLPGQVQQLGTWSLVFAAMISPYCFAPRPFSRSAAMLGPLAIGAFVGLVGAVIMRKH